MTPEGIAIYPSSYGPKETVDRLAAAVASRGITVFARIDHAEAAAKVGMMLRPTEVIIFGNPRAGTPLMQARQTIGIDLPLKALVWQDEEGTTGSPTTRQDGSRSAMVPKRKPIAFSLPWRKRWLPL